LATNEIWLSKATSPKINDVKIEAGEKRTGALVELGKMNRNPDNRKEISDMPPEIFRIHSKSTNPLKYYSNKINMLKLIFRLKLF
jgi:hypothetical protein